MPVSCILCSRILVYNCLLDDIEDRRGRGLISICRFVIIRYLLVRRSMTTPAASHGTN